jgi:hypothetical protein
MEVSGQLPHCGNIPRHHCIGGWICPRADIDVVWKKKISLPCRESNPDSSVAQPVAWSLYRLNYTGNGIGVLSAFCNFNSKIVLNFKLEQK